MNKYTLQFKCDNLEIEYQQRRLDEIVYPCAQWLSMLCFGYQTYRLIIDVVGNQSTRLIFNMLLILEVITGSIFIRWNKKYSKFYLILVNYTGVLIQFDTYGLEDKDQHYILGMNMGIFCSSVLISCDFRQALHQTFLMPLAQLIITYEISGKYNVANFGGLFGLHSLLLMTIYWSDKNSRISFLLSKQDQIWVNNLNTILNGTFYLFRYDTEQRGFRLISQSFKSAQPYHEQDESMRSFFRECIYQKASFDKFLFQLQAQNQQKNLEVQVKYRNRMLIIRLIVLINNEYLAILKDVQINKYHPLINMTQNFVSCYANFLKSTKLNSQNARIQIINQTFITMLSINSNAIRIIDLLKTIKTIVRRYNKCLSYNIVVIQEFSQNDFTITTYKDKLIAYIIFILNQLENGGMITLKISKHETTVNLKIFIPFHESFHQRYLSYGFIYQIERLLLIEPVQPDLEFKFMREPQYSFYHL